MSQIDIRYRIRYLISLVLCGILSSGCIRRSLTITTEPPGAMVYVNDELKGESPVTYDFIWYGSHRLILRKDGYERIQETKFIRSPFYFWIPFDLAMELLPFPIRDRRAWSYTLNPLPTMATPIPPSELPQEPSDDQTR
ncbi:MAG: PEGA domain-containing protein [Candidatus Omnitrophica bacterium]|nr:PEGA domain-containing protein [Candidatus Omnitrophota bacterium]